jgi:hypothetical protein
MAFGAWVGLGVALGWAVYMISIYVGDANSYGKKMYLYTISVQVHRFDCLQIMFLRLIHPSREYPWAAHCEQYRLSLDI